jgi:heat shock protein HslJ
MERDAARCRPAAMNPSRLIVIALLLAACSAGSTDSLEGRTFVSTSVTEGGQDRPLVAGTEIRLTFNDGQIGASAGCNMFGGGYHIDGAALVVDGGAMTEMGCDDDRSAQDEWLFAFLGASPQAALSDDGLVLSVGETVITLLDREVAEPDLALVGPTWTVDTIIIGNVASTIPEGEVATIAFADDGTVDFQTGCNTGGGRYAVNDGEIQFAELVQTEIGCDGAAAAMEEAVVAVLNAGAVTDASEADTLTLMAGDHGLVLRGT